MGRYKPNNSYYFRLQQNIRNPTDFDKEQLKSMEPIPPFATREFYSDFGNGKEEVGAIETSGADYSFDFSKGRVDLPGSFRALYYASGMLKAGSFANALDILITNLVEVQPVRLDQLILGQIAGKPGEEKSVGLTYSWNEGSLRLEDPHKLKYKGLPEDSREHMMFKRRIEECGKGSVQLYLPELRELGIRHQ